MSGADPLRALTLPFAEGLLLPPDAARRFGFLNARPLPDPEVANWKTALICEQRFRPDFLALRAGGYEPVAELPAETETDGCLVLLGKFRRLNEANIARAWRITRAGGMVVVAGENRAGGASARKWLDRLVGGVDSRSKHHSTVFWCRRGEGAWPLGDEDESAGGWFSAGKPDAGSALLADRFDQRIAGAVADFGAGAGFLSAELLARCPSIGSLDLLEADWAALQAAKATLSGIDSAAQRRFHWRDVTSEPVERSFDWIVMNPPFHGGIRADPGLGKRFIDAAADALRPGGRLLMVANRKLPYEPTLNARFSSSVVLYQGQGYKIIEAVR